MRTRIQAPECMPHCSVRAASRTLGQKAAPSRRSTLCPRPSRESRHWKPTFRRSCWTSRSRSGVPGTAHALSRIQACMHETAAVLNSSTWTGSGGDLGGVQAPSGPKQLDYSKRKELALRNHLDTIAESLSQARAAGQAAGAPAAGLGFGDAWPAPTSGKKGGVKELKATKAVVRNAERPATPVHAPPADEDAAHRAAALLQRLVRGRAIQNDMLDAADARAALLTELMTPLASGCSAAAAVPMREARVAAMVAAALQPVLMCASPLRTLSALYGADPALVRS